jgi:hypothetical protein
MIILLLNIHYFLRYVQDMSNSTTVKVNFL